MSAQKKTLTTRLMRRRWLLLGVWLAVLAWFGGATWVQVVRQHRQIGDLEARLAETDRWNVAGLWLGRSLAAREAAVGARWQRLFPTERRREELFLTMAGIADSSGVAAFELTETTVREAEAPDAGTEMVAPTVDLAPVSSYRIHARFHGGYREVARFLGGLNGIERAVSLHNLVLQPLRDGVQVDLEMDVYVDESQPS